MSLVGAMGLDIASLSAVTLFAQIGANLWLVSFARLRRRTDLRGGQAYDTWSGHPAPAPAPRPFVARRIPVSNQAEGWCRDLRKDIGHRKPSSTPRTLARPCSGRARQYRP